MNGGNARHAEVGQYQEGGAWMVQIKKRVLLAKMGTDGHDIGLKFIAHVLREAGMEVIYLGPYQTPEKVFNTAVQEWVDVIGISSLSGEYMTFVPILIDLLKKKKLDRTMKIILGGLIAKEDADYLRNLGVEHIFHLGATSSEILDGINASGGRERSGERRSGKGPGRERGVVRPGAAAITGRGPHGRRGGGTSVGKKTG